MLSRLDGRHAKLFSLLGVKMIGHAQNAAANTNILVVDQRQSETLSIYLNKSIG